MESQWSLKVFKFCLKNTTIHKNMLFEVLKIIDYNIGRTWLSGLLLKDILNVVISNGCSRGKSFSKLKALKLLHGSSTDIQEEQLISVRAAASSCIDWDNIDSPRSEVNLRAKTGS